MSVVNATSDQQHIPYAPMDVDETTIAMNKNMSRDFTKTTGTVTQSRASIAQTMQLDEELQRLRNLQTYHLLDQANVDSLDRYNRLAANILDCDIATISLIDLGREWCVSSLGWPVREIAREESICAQAIQQGEGLVLLRDVAQSTFRDFPFVKSHGVRFFVAVPLVSTEGHKLGALCLMDKSPRPNGLSNDDKMTLMDLAASIMTLMEERRKSIQVDLTPYHFDERNIVRSVKFLQSHLQSLCYDQELYSLMDYEQQETFVLADEIGNYLYDSIVQGKTDLESPLRRLAVNTLPDLDDQATQPVELLVKTTAPDRPLTTDRCEDFTRSDENNLTTFVELALEMNRNSNESDDVKNMIPETLEQNKDCNDTVKNEKNMNIETGRPIDEELELRQAVQQW